MLAQLKLDIADDTQVLAARHLTLVRSNLWDQAGPVSAAWVEANVFRWRRSLLAHS